MGTPHRTSHDAGHDTGVLRVLRIVRTFFAEPALADEKDVVFVGERAQRHLQLVAVFCTARAPGDLSVTLELEQWDDEHVTEVRIALAIELPDLLSQHAAAEDDAPPPVPPGREMRQNLRRELVEHALHLDRDIVALLFKCSFCAISDRADQMAANIVEMAHRTNQILKSRNCKPRHR